MKENKEAKTWGSLPFGVFIIHKKASSKHFSSKHFPMEGP